MKLQVTARHQSPVRVSGPKSAPHFSSDKVEGDMIPTPDAIITINTRMLRSIGIGVAIKPLRGIKNDQKEFLFFFFFQIGFLFFCERTVTLFLEIFCLLG